MRILTPESVLPGAAGRNNKLLLIASEASEKWGSGGLPPENFSGTTPFRTPETPILFKREVNIKLTVPKIWSISKN